MSETTSIPDLYLDGDSKQWKNWQAIYLDIKTCEDCRKKHGKIYKTSTKIRFCARFQFYVNCRNVSDVSSPRFRQ